MNETKLIVFYNLRLRLLKGKEESISRSLCLAEEKHWIKKGLHPILTEKESFSFDSFTTFRLKSFYQSLEKYAMQAIDEYKLEQDYQNFIAHPKGLYCTSVSRKCPICILCTVMLFIFMISLFASLNVYEITDMIDRQLLSKARFI